MRNLNALVLAVVAALALAPVARADLVTRLPTQDKVVALTFDACQAHAPAAFDKPLLDYLLARKLPFTLFVSGRFAETNASDLQRLAREPQVEFGNHSWDHPNTMDRFTPEAVRRQAERADAGIEAVTGRAPRFFRFPAGNLNDAGLAAVEAMGMPVVHWRWASGDPSRGETAEKLHARVMRLVQPGDILIFHINGRGWHTAEALPRIVESLEAEGYRFVQLSDYIATPRKPPTAVERTAQRAQDLISRAFLGAAGQVPFGGAL